MPSNPLVFAFPMPPNLANSRMHWRVKHNAKVAYWETLDTLVLLKRLPKPPTQRIKNATMTGHLVLFNPMDDDNAMARAKWAQDWLVARKYLTGDSRKCLRWSALPTQEVNRKLPSTLTLTLTPE